MSIPRCVAILLGVGIFLGLPLSVAHADASLDRAGSFFEEARFVEALEALIVAEAGSDLTRRDLGELYALRAAAHLALGQDQEMRVALGCLAVVNPRYTFDRRTPPDLVRAFTEARAGAVGVLRLVAQPTQVRGGVSISASVSGDALDLVRSVRVVGRPAETRDWEDAEDAPLLISTGAEVVEYYAEAIGPGGAVLATVGRPTDPLRFANTVGNLEPRVEEGAGSRRGLVWALVGVGVALVAGAVVLAVVLPDRGGDVTQVDPFSVRF